MLFGFRFVSDIDKVFLLCSDLSEKVADDIINRFGKTYSIEKIIINPSSFDDIVLSLYHRINKYEQVIINLTGGTKIMVLALFFIAQITNSSCFYIFKNKNNDMIKVDVPIISIPEKLESLYNKLIKGNNKKGIILKILIESDSGTISLTSLKDLLKITKSTLTGHINTLVNHRMVERFKHGNKLFISITPTGKILYNILKNIT